MESSVDEYVYYFRHRRDNKPKDFEFTLTSK